MKTALRVSLFVLLIGALSASFAFGGARRFTFVYEAPTTPPGVIEFENSATWQTHTPNDSRFNEVDFRHELEFGITNNFQASVYVADWNYHRNSPSQLQYISKPLA